MLPQLIHHVVVRRHRVPEDSAVASRRCRNADSVFLLDGREDAAFNSIAVPLQHSKDLPRLRVPNRDRLVRGSCDDVRAVVRPRHVVDPVGVAASQRERGFPRPCVPEPSVQSSPAVASNADVWPTG